MRALLAGSVALLLAAGTAAHGYIDTLVARLDQFSATFQVVAEGRIEKVDVQKRICVIQVGRALKGKPEITHVRVNIGAGQGWHPEVVMPHLVPGAPVLLWYYWGDGPKAAIYVNRFFLETYRNDGGAPPDPGRVWWHFSSVALLFNRTFHGSVEELAALLPPLLAGRAKGPEPDPKLPCITRESLAALPLWGQAVDLRKLPMAFRPRRSANAEAPREPDKHGALTPGLALRSYEGTWTSIPDFDRLPPGTPGTSPTIALPEKIREGGYGLRYAGFLDVPRDGVYTFTLTSNDGATLHLGATLVVDNDHFKSVVESSGDISLKAGRHALRVDYVQHSGFQVLEACWAGPGLERQEIPAGSLFRERP